MSNILGMSGPSKLGWALGGGLLVAAATSACGGDDPAHWDPVRPRIDAVRYEGQSPRDALGLQFMLTFVDGDGDLGQGVLHLLLDGTEAGSIPLEELFAAQTPPVAAGATEGDFEVLVRLSATPEAGKQITVGFLLVDEAGHQSNQPSVTLAALAPGGT